MGNRELWYERLKKREAWCYIKPNRHIHDSGYRCFEVGYCTLTEDGMRTKERLILNEYSDHFWHRPSFSFDSRELPESFSMDILLDGYIRVFDTSEILTWENQYDFVCSSFNLEIMSDGK